MCGLITSSFGAIYDLAFLAYFWYLALAGIASMLITSCILGIALLFSRSQQNRALRRGLTQGQRAFS
jgi:hypothetical protein